MTNKLGYTGTRKRPTKNGHTFEARARHKGEKVHIGSFESLKDAAIAYDIWVIKFRKPFKIEELNFPEFHPDKHPEITPLGGKLGEYQTMPKSNTGYRFISFIKREGRYRVKFTKGDVSYLYYSNDLEEALEARNSALEELND